MPTQCLSVYHRLYTITSHDSPTQRLLTQYMYDKQIYNRLYMALSRKVVSSHLCMLWKWNHTIDMYIYILFIIFFSSYKCNLIYTCLSRICPKREYTKYIIHISHIRYTHHVDNIHITCRIYISNTQNAYHTYNVRIT